MLYVIILIVSLALSAVGFYRYIYFFSIGYGLAVAGIGAALLLLFGMLPALAGMPVILTAGTAAACVLFFIYGLRLAGYLAVREKKSAAYNKVLAPENERSKHMAVGIKLAIWISCGILYFLQTSPVTFRLANGSGTDLCLLIGLVIMAAGILIEILADMQKTRAKKSAPGRFVDIGLYRLVRCPNYLGELLLWTGVLISGLTAMHGTFQWCIVLLGWLGIVYVMFSGARRLELRQQRNYGSDPAYRKYAASVPIMIPFVPLYSVADWKMFVA